jgi:antitoxin component of RelBE/YafQ-DinJ toxin-antitoxin module
MMDAVLTVRLDKEVKERVSSILKDKGLTPSATVQRLFAHILETGDIPFAEPSGPTAEEIEQRLATFARFQLKEPLQMNDAAIRAARISERYGIDAG